MSARPENDRDQLAAEYALGVLDEGERVRAAQLAAGDPAFAGLIANWDERLAPLLDEILAVAPDAALWDRINEALDAAGDRPVNVVQLSRRLTRWRTYSAAMSAIAAALLLVIAVDPFGSRVPEVQPKQQRQPMLIANVAAEDSSAAFTVAFDPADRTLLVSPAVATPAPGHDHQLWLIPASGTPRSLGLVASLSPHRLTVSGALLPEFQRDVTIAISVEPVGGSPTGQPTGPVVATGKLTAI